MSGPRQGSRCRAAGNEDLAEALNDPGCLLKCDLDESHVASDQAKPRLFDGVTFVETGKPICGLAVARHRIDDFEWWECPFHGDEVGVLPSAPGDDYYLVCGEVRDELRLKQEIVGEVFVIGGEHDG